MTTPQKTAQASAKSLVIAAVILTAVDAGAQPVTCLRSTSDGHQLVVASQKGLTVRDWNTLQVDKVLSHSLSHVHDVQLNADQTRMYVAGGEPGESGIVACYAWPDLVPQWSVTISEDLIYALALSDNGQTLAAAAHDHSIYLLNASTGGLGVTLTDHSRPVRGVLFVDSTTIASCSLDQSIRLWASDTGSVVRALTNHTLPPTEMAQRPSFEGLPMIASGGEDRTVRLWQPTIGRLVRFKRFRSAVQSVTFTNDGQFVVCGCRDGFVQFTNADTLETITAPNQFPVWVTGLVAHPNQTAVAAGCADGSIHVIDTSFLYNAEGRTSRRHPSD